MKNFFLLTTLLVAAHTAQAEEKFLSYQFNEHVVIRIANVECPLKALKKEYPNGAVAMRADGQYLFGCFTHKGDDIVIQWAAGDKSIFPANYFLMGKPDL